MRFPIFYRGGATPEDRQAILMSIFETHCQNLKAPPPVEGTPWQSNIFGSGLEERRTYSVQGTDYSTIGLLLHFMYYLFHNPEIPFDVTFFNDIHNVSTLNQLSMAKTGTQEQYLLTIERLAACYSTSHGLRCVNWAIPVNVISVGSESGHFFTLFIDDRHAVYLINPLSKNGEEMIPILSKIATDLRDVLHREYGIDVSFDPAKNLLSSNFQAGNTSCGDYSLLTSFALLHNGMQGFERLSDYLIYNETIASPLALRDIIMNPLLKRCPNCTLENIASLIQCLGCDQPLPDLVAVDLSTGHTSYKLIRCPTCGFDQNDPSLEKCNRCGAPLAGGEVIDSKEDPQSRQRQFEQQLREQFIAILDTCDITTR